MGVVMRLDRTLRNRRCSFAEQRTQRIPSRALPEILTFAGNGAQSLQDHSIGQRGSDVGVVVRRADLNDVHPHHRELQADPTDRVQQFARGQPAWFGCSGARRMTWVANIDVDGEEHPVAVIGGDGKRLGQALASGRAARSRSSHTNACSARPSSPGSPEAASSREARFARTDHRAGHPIR